MFWKLNEKESTLEAAFEENQILRNQNSELEQQLGNTVSNDIYIKALTDK